LRIHIKSIGNNLYCIIGHPKESTILKKECIFVCSTNTLRPSFKFSLALKIWNQKFLKLVGGWRILGKP
jgi:hypothetical protein